MRRRGGRRGSGLMVLDGEGVSLVLWLCVVVVVIVVVVLG